MGPGAMRMGQAALAEGEQGRRYDGVARTFHWAIVVLLLVQYGTKLIPASWANENLTDAWHIAVGPAILLLMVLRLGWRLTHRPPPAPTDLPAALRLLSRATHWAFYALLIVLPVLGWVSASGFGARPSIFGLVPLPMLIGMDKAAAMAWGGGAWSAGLGAACGDRAARVRRAVSCPDQARRRARANGLSMRRRLENRSGLA